MSRHSEFTEEMATRILDWIADGETLRDFCRQEGTPAWRTVYHWLEANPNFQARFTQARDLGMDAIAEEALHIADTPFEGSITTVGTDGKTESVRREDMLGHRKLRVETRLKLLAKWHPKKYGDRLGITGEGGGPIVLQMVKHDDAL